MTPSQQVDQFTAIQSALQSANNLSAQIASQVQANQAGVSSQTQSILSASNGAQGQTAAVQANTQMQAVSIQQQQDTQSLLLAQQQKQNQADAAKAASDAAFKAQIQSLISNANQ